MITNMPAKGLFKKRYEILVCIVLVLATFAIYFQIGAFEFKNYDTDIYVYENNRVRAGLNWHNFRWALTTTYFGNWLPLTWLSHMLDVQLYGLDAKSHYLTNLMFHMANTLLLFWVFRRMGGGGWRSCLVAALFALHPLHVESVAWIAERKDVLCTFWGLLTLWCYIGYAQRPQIGRYVAVFLFFILGLMSKPMLVTLPFVMLLLDYWPLKRMQWDGAGQDNNTAKLIGARLFLVVEKIPLFIASAASCIVTFYAQKASGAVGSLAALPMHDRIANALFSYVRYIAKMLWPTNLAVIYPYPEDFPLWMVSAACLLIAAVTYLALKHAKTRPWLLVGWLWYLGTLVPVIGLVQVGHQAMADRYTYIPSIGLFIIIAWGASQLAARWRYGKTVLTIMALSAVCCLSLVTRTQLRHWENSVTLFRHTIEVTKKNTAAHNNLGNALLEKADAQIAIKHFATVLALNPKNAKAQNNLGNAFMKIERVDEAIGHYLESIELAPAVARTHNNLAVALYRQKQMAESIRHFLTALRLKPDYAEAYNNLGAAYRRTGQGERAARSYLKAIELRPDFAEAYNNLGILLLHQGKPKTASSYFHKALAAKPGYQKAQENLKKVKAAQEQYN
jgi:Flp pilus assembly protein TadD